MPGNSRRWILRSLSLCLALAAAASHVAFDGAYAQPAYPSKPIRVVVGFAAGGPSDIVARVVGASMSKTLGEQVYPRRRFR
jgi:tripartite-type tricarboxylate transporter receptor subunit TctC